MQDLPLPGILNFMPETGPVNEPEISTIIVVEDDALQRTGLSDALSSELPKAEVHQFEDALSVLLWLQTARSKLATRRILLVVDALIPIANAFRGSEFETLEEYHQRVCQQWSLLVGPNDGESRFAGVACTNAASAMLDGLDITVVLTSIAPREQFQFKGDFATIKYLEKVGNLGAYVQQLVKLTLQVDIESPGCAEKSSAQ